MQRLAPLMIVLCLLFVSSERAAAQAETEACTLPGRLQTGQLARVVPATIVNLRQQPGRGAALVGRLRAGEIFRVADGARCEDTYHWWQVTSATGTAWAAEGDAKTLEYWLEPLGGVDEPEGCLQPPEDYTHLAVGYGTLNARTLAMLDHAQALYRFWGGYEIDFRRAVMQGSYAGGAVAASFGTHDGGGAVDLSVRGRADRRILTDDIAPMLLALRTAGFAAWLRETDELHPGSPIHIHAIAVGDAELSDAARAQIDGTFGYLRGYDGLPRDDGLPRPDRSGELLVCNWMKTLGFDDLRD